MYTLKSVGVFSVAKMVGAIYGVMGLLVVPLFLSMAMFGWANAGGNSFGGAGAAFGIALAVMAPILYGLMGFVTGAIGALLYNVFAKWMGGFELQLQAPLMPQEPRQ